jgi:glucose-1-phosphate thymidylyltransferase
MAGLTTKALILCAGRGTRLRPLTHTTAKHLLPVANKPILFYILDYVRAASITHIGIVVSPETGNQIREAVGDGSKWGAHVTYITQSEPLGLAHAVKEARDFLSDSSFLMLLGDNLSQGAVTDLISQFNSDNPDALILLKEVPDPEAFGTAELNEKKEVIRVVEKAKEPRSNFAIAGIYLFTAEIHSAIAQIKPSRRGELEITDAIQKLLEMGKKVDSHILDGWWVDTGTGDDLLKANRVILDDFLERDIAGTVDSLSRITGRVQIQQAAEVANSTVRGPVSIAENCRIKNSFVGPFTSIGPGTVVENTSVEHSIILENCHLRHIQHLADSIIGKNTKVLKGEYKSNITNLVIGDDARIRS